MNRSRINELTYYVKYKDAEGFTCEIGAAYPAAFQTLSEFTREGLIEDEQAGRVQLIDVKSFIIKEDKHNG